jgi:hypothetical protein
MTLLTVPSSGGTKGSAHPTDDRTVRHYVVKSEQLILLAPTLLWAHSISMPVQVSFLFL